MRAKFAFLEAGDFDVVVVEVRRELPLRSADAVDVELENSRSRDCILLRTLSTRALRTRMLRLLRRLLLLRLMSLRAGIGVDAGDEEEEENEPTGKSF